MRTVKQTVQVGATQLTLHRPEDPESLLDEEAFAHDEFLPYWAELWPAATALANALPPSLEEVRIVELGCGLGLPSLVAAARGARVTAIDWSEDAIALLRTNAARNGLEVEAAVADWRDLSGRWELALAADVLYEHRNVAPVLRMLEKIAPEALVGLAGRPYEAEFLCAVSHAEVADRVVRVSFGDTDSAGLEPSPA